MLTLIIDSLPFRFVSYIIMFSILRVIGFVSALSTRILSKEIKDIEVSDIFQLLKLLNMSNPGVLKGSKRTIFTIDNDAIKIKV